MRILHVDETFHPAFGYQCNPLAKFQAKQGNDVTIITVEAKHLYPVYREFGDNGEHLPEQDAEYERVSGVRVVRVPARGYVLGRLIYDYRALFSAIEAAHPDAMMVHCLETLTSVRLLFRYSGEIPMVFDSHMLSMASKNPLAPIYDRCFRAFVTPKIKQGSYTVVKTQDDDYVTSHLGIPDNQARFISFGTDTDLFCPNRDAKTLFCKEKGLPEDCLVVVSTGKLTEVKGGMIFADAVKRKFDSSREVVVVVLGGFADSYQQRVREVLGESENRVFFYPVQQYLNLPYFYQIADVSVFPRQCSMSFYDSEACGTPVISEDNGVNKERNSHGNGLCFSAGDVDSLRGAIQRFARMDKAEYEGYSTNARNYVVKSYGYESIAALYTEELERARGAHLSATRKEL